ncbi:hypothetical protein [Photobacterium galatheae]|uniref:ABM domain-containing protein n=1 Tax=Photobacterium galatheae TaxID=1654360 RepID=A0A066RQ21_9GAMM|nr:hypothetical protein [Photobacterium galatheae]KDM92469.1 hypothetical protein EA58_05880 [Photobacterium galatheae]MCM0147948.1 hypothetical protein [Photobacterium galatheae]
MTQQNVVEIVQFKLTSGVSESDLMVANEAFQAWVQQQPGLLYRSLAKDSESLIYTDIIYWESMAHAKAVSDAFPSTEVCQQLTQLIDRSSVGITHHTIVSQSACTG